MEFKPNDSTLELIARRFKTLSDPRRLKILHQLKDAERCGKDIVEATGLSQSTVSKQLSALVENGIVVRRQEGAMACFSIRDPMIVGMCDMVCETLRLQAQENLDQLNQT